MAVKVFAVKTPSLALVVGTALAVLALVAAGGARADLGAPTVELGTISLLDGAAALTGSIASDEASADLKINGQPVDVDASGAFSAVIDLDGESELVLSLTGEGGESTTIRIPVSVLQADPDGVLDALNDAGISIELPEGGFKLLDGNPPLVTGSVANDKSLTSLTINGTDVLGRLGPDGSFTIVPQGTGSRSGVTVVATDTRGVSQTSVFPTTHVSSVINTRAGASVSAAGARGIVISKVRLDKRNLKTMKRLGVVVTVKDRRGLLIRGAALRLNGKPPRYLANGPARAGFTNRFGQARFMYRLHKSAFARCGCKQLVITVRASTPSAATKKKAQVRLPALRRA